ncbi:MAG: hypothetical protein DRH57_08155 [Candidatus Cloacimonadota bacterium]|nr:MAG: hypothetical protein DRH57_08155 [Candidatus Cloacimonadota bacterium]
MKNIGLRTVLFTLIFFGFIYMLLVFTNRAGKTLYLFSGVVLLLIGIFLFLKSIKIQDNAFISNLLAIFSGISLWGFVGEFLENADLYINDATVEIAHWNFLPILLLVIFLFLNLRRHFPIPAQFSLASFILIWTLHYIMIFQFEVLSRTHFSTYIMCGIFVLLMGFSIYKVKNGKDINSIMFWSYFGLLSVWSVLEYIWGWRLIPGPYSI